jgi:hypothetical protein
MEMVYIIVRSGDSAFRAQRLGPSDHQCTTAPRLPASYDQPLRIERRVW